MLKVNYPIALSKSHIAYMNKSFNLLRHGCYAAIETVA